MPISFTAQQKHKSLTEYIETTKTTIDKSCKATRCWVAIVLAQMPILRLVSYRSEAITTIKETAAQHGCFLIDRTIDREIRYVLNTLNLFGQNTDTKAVVLESIYRELYAK